MSSDPPVVDRGGARVPLAGGTTRDLTPPRRSCGGSVAAAAAVVVGLGYVLNLGWGVFELIPDNVPVFGNLDEAGATALLLFGLRYLLRRQGPPTTR